MDDTVPMNHSSNLLRIHPDIRQNLETCDHKPSRLLKDAAAAASSISEGNEPIFETFLVDGRHLEIHHGAGCQDACRSSKACVTRQLFHQKSRESLPACMGGGVPYKVVLNQNNITVFEGSVARM